VEDAQMQDSTYKIISDSLAYNLNDEVATLFMKSYIWNEKGDILSAVNGKYYHQTSDYQFTKDSYILTADQEVWADSLFYNSVTENAELWRDIQIRDEEHKVIAFGYYGRYWGQTENAMLTRNPSLVSFDPEQDTLYMRADSMFMYSHPYDLDLTKSDSIATGMGDIGGEQLMPSASTQPGAPDSTVMGGRNFPNIDSLRNVMTGGDSTLVGADSLGHSMIQSPQDSIAASAPADLIDAPDSVIQDIKKSAKELKAEQRRKEKEAKRAEKEARRAEKEAMRAARGNKASEVDDHPVHDGHNHPHVESAFEPQDSIGGHNLTDSLHTNVLDSTSMRNAADSAGMGADSLKQDSITTDSTQVQPVEHDSLQRVLFGYHNVRMFRNDFQAVCDSIVGFSKDSTLHMYILPVLWNGANQVTSEVIDVFTRNQELDKALFTGGDPLMISKVDSVHYNQVKGKTMEALFRDNDIYRHNVMGNGQTYYYLEDDETKDLMGFLVAECADITFLIDNQQMDKIIWRGDPVYVIYPMDKIPAEQERFLPGFKWEADRRPTLESVFTRTINASQRETVSAIPQPQFPITQAIMLDKGNKIKNGLWIERNDTLSLVAIEFLHSLQTEE
jgi:hypothetical protein